ncbi:MAG: ATP-binding cassette domain-containing protein, partial [Prevotella sp.]|nr:ATP-binding cassette domain-containing protein [Prevotella sp.]
TAVLISVRRSPRRGAQSVPGGVPHVGGSACRGEEDYYFNGTSSSKKEAKKRAEELLAFLGLTERAQHKPNELSGGEKQRVAVARALVNNPAIILADEPSGSLDTKNKEELHQLFFELRDKFGQTFVIVTHDEQLASTTDRTIKMKDGMLESENDFNNNNTKEDLCE